MAFLARTINPLAIILFAGVLVRVGLTAYCADFPPKIGDEKSYNRISVSLANSGEFSANGEPTSIRPPLYPALVASIYLLFGVENFAAVRVIQCILGICNSLLVYQLTLRLFPDSSQKRTTALIAASLYCFYPSLLFFEQLLLTETLFTFWILLLCICVARFLQKPTSVPALIAGALVGLAALTRSVLWLFPPIAAIALIALFWSPQRPRIVHFIIFFLGFSVVLAPWSYRNSQLQRSFTTVDVMGGRNFMMGNYEHTPMFRAWDAISIQGRKSWIEIINRENKSLEPLTQGQIDKLALQRGLKFVKENPGLTLQRDLVKLVNFWQLERSVAAGFSKGFWGKPPRLAMLMLAGLFAGTYAIVLIAGTSAFILNKKTPIHWFVLLLISFVCGIHTLVFGHSRYHLSLMALVIPFAAYMFVNWRPTWSLATLGAKLTCCLAVALLAGSWIFEAAVIERLRFQKIYSSSKTALKEVECRVSVDI